MRRRDVLLQLVAKFGRGQKDLMCTLGRENQKYAASTVLLVWNKKGRKGRRRRRKVSTIYIISQQGGQYSGVTEIDCAAFDKTDSNISHESGVVVLGSISTSKQSLTPKSCEMSIEHLEMSTVPRFFWRFRWSKVRSLSR